jgi:hypothetical protein
MSWVSAEAMLARIESVLSVMQKAKLAFGRRCTCTILAEETEGNVVDTHAEMD